MGNSVSFNNNTQNINNKTDKICQLLDDIVTYYILTMNFYSLRKMYNKQYCEKLVKLTTNIIERHFSVDEIKVLFYRINYGEINTNSNIKINTKIKSSPQINYMCICIAKFYVKIAHIFASIVTTINPMYIYKDTNGNIIRTSLSDKDNVSVPENASVEIYKINMCDDRIKLLQNIESLKTNNNDVDDNTPEIKIDAKIDDPCIPELIYLYNDDNYDFKTGKFTQMSENTQNMFMNDLQLFYAIFTGKQGKMPPEITKFSDIKLRDYCKTNINNDYNNNNNNNNNNSQFIRDYAVNLRNSIQNTNNNQSALLSMIDRMFVYDTDTQGNKYIHINYDLTAQQLQEIVEVTRGLIIELYLKCEMDYVNGLKIYEAIVDHKILDTTNKQIKYLQSITDKIAFE